ncbi:MAG: hypothetical protein IKO99_07320 [Bacteroidales bacterium]|nr:hypothetical protein [Bacteroidales bacterium]
MKVNKENIEEYLLDYSEGSLSQEDKKQVEVFLKKNPQYREMLEGISEFRLDAGNVVFEKKDSLKHTSEFDYPEFKYSDRLAVSVLEGLATKEEQTEYQKLISESASFKKDVALYSRTKLQADSQIVYENKNGLKHFALVFWRYAAAVAAVLIAGIFAAFFFQETTKEISGVYTCNYEIKTRKSVEKNIVLEPQQTFLAENTAKPKKTAAVKTVEETVLPLPDMEDDVIIKSAENETLAGADLSSLRVENVLKNELPQTEFPKILAENSEPESKTKTNFIGGRLFRFAQKIDLEVYRSEDGSFIALDLITPNKKYSLKKL